MLSQINLDEARCTQVDPEVFFGEGQYGNYESVRQAKALCAQCPISLQCLAEAMENGYTGIWGGLTTTERKNLRRKANYRAFKLGHNVNPFEGGVK
ncbi:Transcription factor WhiB [uncultured Caudovirales phage]|uniref:Transcription factor WhiB n=1 Tax=uncultured Caudovirales phage TaxID=2100421 RepID=A0A6J5KT23_9CAUD|nr:Transcription factor WhiB [uncultured Caudovirales phage]